MYLCCHPNILPSLGLVPPEVEVKGIDQPKDYTQLLDHEEAYDYSLRRVFKDRTARGSDHSCRRSCDKTEKARHTTKADMVNDRRTEPSASLFAKSGRKFSGFVSKQPTSLLHQLDKGTISVQKKPNAKVTSKTAPKAQINSGQTPKMAEDPNKNNVSRFPLLPTVSSSTPRKAKVSFPPSQQLVVSRRRLSVPEESINRLPKPILKKRHSVSTMYDPPNPRDDHVDLSALCSLPWHRELYFPPITHNGMLVFLDEDGSLPPMLRRLSGADSYSYSQEFLEALNDLKNRPRS